MPFNREALITQLTGEEASRRFVYDDKTDAAIRSGTLVQGNPTVGVGRNLASKGLSADEVKYLLNNDIDEITANLDAAFPWWVNLPDGPARALMDLAFNMGMAGLETFHNFLAAMESGQWAEAVAQLKNSAWWEQVKERGPMVAALIMAGVGQGEAGAA